MLPVARLGQMYPNHVLPFVLSFLVRGRTTDSIWLSVFLNLYSNRLADLEVGGGFNAELRQSLIQQMVVDRR